MFKTILPLNGFPNPQIQGFRTLNCINNPSYSRAYGTIPRIRLCSAKGVKFPTSR